MSGSRILVVDDDQMVRGYLRNVAEELGYEVTTASDTESFKQTFKASDPDIVLLDLVIPGTDGIDMLKFLASAHCKVPVVLMSGLDERSTHAAGQLENTHGLRMFGGLEKPFDLEMLEEVLGRCGLERRSLQQDNLLDAIDRGELRLHYQPLVDVTDKRVCGAEALLRWEHPDFGLLLPGYFLPAAEQSEAIRSVTRWVCAEATTQLAHWREAGHDFPLSLNLSVRDIKDDTFPGWLERQVRDQGLDASSIVLELPEREASADIDEARENLTRLRLKGFQLSLDDFGTGYSSLEMLQQGPFGELKIDKCFVMESLAEAEARIIVQSVVNLGHKLGLRVVGEGVEEEGVLDLLRELGADAIQGYLTGHPMSVEEFTTWLGDGTLTGRRTA